LSESTTPGSDAAGDKIAGRFRPEAVAAVPLAAIGQALGVAVPDPAAEVEIRGISLNSRTVEPGDLYVALPGATRHGADFVTDAIGAGAAAVLTDEAGARLLALASDMPLPVLVVDKPRNEVGPLSATIYRSQSGGGRPMPLFGVTGTNGKTTTTYFITSLLRALGRRTGLIGTIEILAGGEPIPSLLTTPESPEVHGLLALMHERGLVSPTSPRTTWTCTTRWKSTSPPKRSFSPLRAPAGQW